MKNYRINKAQYYLLISLLVPIELQPQSSVINSGPVREKPIQYRRGTELMEGYQSYEQDYAGKDLEEEKRRLFPMQSNGVWTELNPKVPRVDYLGIHFINKDSGWAVGAMGAVIYSFNSGKTWQTANSPTTNVLLNVHSFNGEVVVASGYNGTIIRSTDAGINWHQVLSGVTGELWEIKMINDTLGWACGTGSSLLKTTNAGLSWNIINTGYNNFNYWALDFLDESVLYVSGSGGNILKTNDGGNSWQLLQTGFGKSLYRIVVFDTLRIVSGGQMGWVSYTFDGGITWNYSTAGGEITAMAFVNDTIGYIAGFQGENIYKTTNGGVTWQWQDDVIGAYWLMFIDDATGFNAGLGLVIKKTTDQGNNWKQMIFNDNLNDVWFESENLGWVLSNNKVAKTIDGGITWNVFLVDPLIGWGLKTILFTDGTTGFIGGESKRIFKTTNGGITWDRKNVFGINDTIYWINDIYFINNIAGWAVSHSGDLLRTNDAGDNWYALSNSIGGIVIQFLDSLLGYNLRGDYLLKTTDGGYNWLQIPLPISASSSDFYFKTSLIGWFITNDQLYLTQNGGSNWIQKLNDPELFQSKLNWLSESKGFITGLKTYFTDDSGNTWINITDEVGVEVKKMHSGNSFSGYAIGDLGLIVKYIDTTVVPVELTSFTASVKEKYNVCLQWITETELNNKGFAVERKKEKNNYEQIGFVLGNGTTTSQYIYNYIDKNLTSGLYKYRLRQIDFDGKENLSNEIEIEVEINPNLFELYTNYPNPFNPYTSIEFKSGKNEKLQLKVFNALGEQVIVLYNDIVEPGKKYKIIFNADNLPSGIYYYLINQDNKMRVSKMVLLK